MSNMGQSASCRFFQGFRPSSLQVNPYIALSADGTFGNHLYLYVPLSTADSRGNFVINRDPGEMLCPIILASFLGPAGCKYISSTSSRRRRYSLHRRINRGEVPPLLQKCKQLEFVTSLNSGQRVYYPNAGKVSEGSY